MGTVAVGMPQRVRRRAARLRSDAQRNLMGAPCLAPYGNLYLGPQGEVRACCANANYLGNIRVQRLPEIWGGVQHVDLRRRLKDGDFSLGCSYCAWEGEQGMGVYARVYDGLKVRSTSPRYPTRIEFALTNACNLQCTMCNGENSSAIRLHREGRLAAPRAYDDQFFDDLAEFVPHLTQASFVGGEPFLGAENFRVWDLLAERNPGAEIGITTNGTQWSARVERVLDALAPAITVSVDGMTKPTFESVRVGADFDEVLANVERFVAHGRRVAKRVNFSHCLMPQNHHEFGDLLVYAEERDIHVHVAVVTTPAECALERRSRDELRRVLALLEEQAERVLPRLGAHNAGVLQAQIERVARAAGADEPPVPAPTIDEEEILGLPRRRPDWSVDGASTAPPEAVVATRLDAADRVLRVGPNDVILDCSAEAAAWLGVEPAAIIGVHVDRVNEVLRRRFGPLEDDTRTITGDVVERSLVAGDTPVGMVAVAARDRAGWIEHVELALGHPVP